MRKSSQTSETLDNYVFFCVCFVEPQKGVQLGGGTKRSFKGTISAGIQPVLS